MSFRLKSLLIFAVAVSLLFGLVVGLVKYFIEGQFDDIERSEMSDAAGGFAADLRGELKSLASRAHDWATWNGLRKYATGVYPDFSPQQLTAETLSPLPFDFVGIWAPDGRLLWLGTRSPGPLRGGGARDAVIDAISRERIVPAESARGAPSSGFMVVERQLALVVTEPITGGVSGSPPAGTLVAGRVFGSQAIISLENLTAMEFALVPRSSAADAIKASSQTPLTVAKIEIASPQRINALIPISNTHGEIVADIELSSGRPLHFQAGKTTRIFIVALASAGGILLFVVWYLLDSQIILPVRKLADKVALGAAEGRLPSDLGVSGATELAALASCIEDLARNVAHAEANYRAVVEDQVDFIFRYLPTGRRTFVNDAFCRYLGRSRELLIGGDAHEIVAEEDIGRVLAVIERLSVSEPVSVIDHRVSAAGGVAWFRRTDRAIFSPDGTLRELQCVARDFTQAHLTRERLEASETRYRRLFETAVDGILLVKRASRDVDDANPALCLILGCRRDTLVGRPIGAIPAFENPKTLRTLASLLDGNASRQQAEISLPRGTDTICHLEVTSAIYDAGGETIVQLNFRDISQRKQAGEELSKLSGHLLRSQDEERRRIARELHDSTAQTLSALQMAVTHLEPFLPQDAGARASLEEVRSLNDASLREIRTMSYLLHPPLLDEAGLLFALRWYVNGFMTRTEKIVRLDVPESLERLQPEIETTIFRIVQEGLTNVHRHSGSRRAWIRLALEGSTLTLVIRDEGKGMGVEVNGQLNPADRPVMGVGVAGMRERMHQLNGTLVIESSSKGTTLRATVLLDS